MITTQHRQATVGDVVRINDRRGHAVQNAEIGDGRIVSIERYDRPSYAGGLSSLYGLPMSAPSIIHDPRPGVPLFMLVFRNGFSNVFYLDELEIVKQEITPPAPKVSLDSVILSAEKKEEIKAAIAQVEHTTLIFDTWGFGAVFEKGTAVSLLFHGNPGTGKTMMTQAIADELGAELKLYGMAEIGSSEPGGAERTIQKIFEEARELFTSTRKQRIILFDECDSLLSDRNGVGVILSAQINALLSEIERHDGVVIFTTNRLGKLDPALERRISAKVDFPFPDAEQREAIWRRLIPEKAPIADDVVYVELATHALAGGNIKNAVLNAARMAAYQGSTALHMSHFVAAIEKEARSVQAFASAASHNRGASFIDPIVNEGNILAISQEILKGEKNGKVAEPCQQTE